MADKPKLIRVTDSVEIEAILSNLDAPMPFGGTSIDGLLMRAEELRAWRLTQSTSNGEQR